LYDDCFSPFYKAGHFNGLWCQHVTECLLKSIWELLASIFNGWIILILSGKVRFGQIFCYVILGNIYIFNIFALDQVEIISILSFQVIQVRF
jgi:hypothetical protein